MTDMSITDNSYLNFQVKNKKKEIILFPFLIHSKSL